LNSIFLRIYAGILLMVLLIGALSYGSIRLVDHYRAASYRQRMAHGTFYLIAQGVERYQTEAERTQWLQVVSQLVGANISLKDSAALGLSDSEKSALADQQVVLRLNAAQNQADIIYALPGDKQYIQTRMSKISEQQARATAYLVLDYLGHREVSDWPNAMSNLKQQFGFPVYYQAFSQTHLDNEQTQRLLRHEVVLSISDSDSRTGSSVTVYAAIGTSGQVLVMGPLFLFDPYPIEMLAIVGLIGLLLLALAAYALVRPLQSRLGHLEEVIKRLGEGDLDARAEVSSQDAIGQLAITFNGMTQHIRRLIESQREMTRAVSHELRTPVARLRFGLEMLPDCQNREEMAQRLDALDADIDQLDALIDEILTFAKLEEGMPAIQFESIYLPDLMEQLRDELQPISPDVSIEVDTKSLALLPKSMCYAEAEKRYLHRVLQNLVTNGVRYGRSRVRMRYMVEGRLACLEVDDDGDGIPVAERERIFQPFARLDQSRQRKSGGYGLGLSIVQRVVEWHGGHVEITESDLGGARFRVAWPRLHGDGQHVLGEAISHKRVS
jgi:two-component system sensor histidine kinase RstB